MGPHPESHKPEFHSWLKCPVCGYCEEKKPKVKKEDVEDE